ncbi:hypothetical protein ACHAW6_005391 [Cyclotella cf. meneghiniana]
MLAPTGNEELGEDPTVIALQEYAEYLFQKQSALYIPTGTKGNLCTILVHCHYNRLAEMILGKHSHINFYEGGGYAICGADSVSICLSKGLGTPMGSVLVGGAEFIRLAKRARKRLGGGMRQSCIMAAMGMYALQHNVDRLAEDHANAQNLARALKNAGFWQLKDGKVDTNVVLFGLPENCKLEKEDLTQALYEGFGVMITGGYSSRGKLFRLVAHMNIDEKEVERATAGIISLCCG